MVYLIGRPLQAFELGGERRNRMLEHEAMGRSRRTAEILLRAPKGEFDRPLALEPRQLLGRARRSAHGPTTCSLFLL